MPNEEYDFAEEFKHKYMAQQRPIPAHVSGEMNPRLQSHPPLGQVTLVGDGETTTLVAVLEVAQIRKEDSWDVALWLSLDESEWTETGLAPVEAGSEPQTLQYLPSSRSRLYFTCSLCIATSMQFTLKFRSGKDDAWRWVRDENGLSDGLVVVTSSSSTPKTLASLIPDLNDEWKVTSHASQSPGTQIWSLRITIPPATGERSTFTDTSVGTPWGSYLR